MKFNKPMKIEPDGKRYERRNIDSLYLGRGSRHKKYYVLDTGWTETMGNPVHCIGELIKETEKEMHFENDEGETTKVSVVSPITNKDVFEFDGESMLDEYHKWVKYRDKNDPDADGRQFMEDSLNLPNVQIIKLG